MKVSWDDDIPNIWENNPVMFQENHQPVMDSAADPQILQRRFGSWIRATLHGIIWDDVVCGRCELRQRPDRWTSQMDVWEIQKISQFNHLF